MKFFLPKATNEVAEESYQVIKKFNERQTRWPLSDVRYYEINYRHNGKALRARVGELDPQERQTVIAIFRANASDHPYLVCTRDRGVARGAPILTSSEALAIEFEPENKPHGDD